VATQAGDIELRIPKPREGSFFPSIIEPRRRIDQALYAVVIEAYVKGVLRYNADGSLDVYIQHDPPDATRAASWLPTSRGELRPILRMYNPRPEAFDDTQWRLPAIRRVP
jgi:hypothetical protein